jgi:hypothetical protein
VPPLHKCHINWIFLIKIFLSLLKLVVKVGLILFIAIIQFAIVDKSSIDYSALVVKGRAIVVTSCLLQSADRVLDDTSST